MKIVMSPSSMWPVKTLLLLACCPALFAEKAAPDVTSKTGVVGYLEQFGYLPSQPSNAAAARSEESVATAMRAFQSFMGLNETGIADEGTISLIKSPRCGVKDVAESNTGKRSKRYVFIGQPWGKRVVTYGITQYSNKLNRRAIDQTIDQAFAVWAPHVPVQFAKSSGQADIEIRFERGRHAADGEPFDGPGRVLAHAFPPGHGIGGDVHFDEDESWTIGGGHGTDFFQIAVHEIGHALGLGHSSVPASIMAPNYRPNMAVRLDSDDITGIKNLYGNGIGGSVSIPRPETPTWPGIRRPGPPIFPGRWGPRFHG